MKITSAFFIALSAAFITAAGCASSVDKSEVEQSANPVREMHRELSQKAEMEKNRIEWYSYGDALVKARKDGKYAMVVFYTTWCKWCKKFEEETLTDPAIAAELSSGFISARIDAESAEEVVHEMRRMPMFELADAYGVKSFPTVWFIEPDGSRAKELNGYMDPAEFARYLTYIKSGAYRQSEF